MENTEKKNFLKNDGSKLTVKLLIIFVISLLLLIPQAFIRDIIYDRQHTEDIAGTEVLEKWGNELTLTGPVIFIPGDSSISNKYILPETLDIQGQVATRTLSRGIYDFTVYDAPIQMHGTFVLPKELDRTKLSHLDFSRAKILFTISDLRGFSDNPALTVDSSSLTLSNEGYQLGGINALSCQINVEKLLADGQVSFDLHVPIKGSNSLKFLPVGRTTSVHVTSDCATPSFNGRYLPAERKVTTDGFDATWRVLALNRSFSQVIGNQHDFKHQGTIDIDLKVPVEQYQQTTRCIKYAYLIIILTFAVVFFVEHRRRRPIHPVQYALVGIALVVFYTLLLSFSEHLSFLLSYIIASVMTIGLITIFIQAILKHRPASLAVGGLLLALYSFIFVLMQMESFALLVGSLGIFAVLALAMYISQKIKWY